MELKTIHRIHGVIRPEDFNGVTRTSIVIEDNGDSIINDLADDGWILFDIQIFYENNVLFDIMYFAREDEDRKSNNLSIITGFDDDVSDLLHGLE